MSLDGFIAGPNGDMSWLSEYMSDQHDTTTESAVSRVGALLIGNRTFRGDDPNKGTDNEGAYGGQWSGPNVVLTHNPPAEPVADTTFCDDLHQAVERARQAAGDKNVSILGADVARQCIEAGLVDEILVWIAPVLLGDGVRLFDHPGGTKVRLAFVETGEPTITAKVLKQH